MVYLDIFSSTSCSPVGEPHLHTRVILRLLNHVVKSDLALRILL